MSRRRISVKSAGQLLTVLALWVPQTSALACAALDAPVTVTGKVVSTMFYGAPNFGEDPIHDEKGYFPVLVPDQPLSLCEAVNWHEDGDVQTARKMQMIFFAPLFGTNWIGKHVSVRGVPFAAETAFHHTPVMLRVKDIRSAP